MTPEALRIEELELTLKATIDYLLSFSPVPATYEVVERAAAVLSKQAAPENLKTYSGEKYLPSGLPLIAAKLVGAKLTLTTVDVALLPTHCRTGHVRDLQKLLTAGVSLELKHKSVKTLVGPR